MTLHLLTASKAYSSWSVRPWIAMKVFGIDFTEHHVSLLREGAETAERLIDPAGKEEILKWSPAGRVPVLRDGNAFVWESLAILDYLADGFPDKPMWPSEKEARAEARAISAEMHAGFQSLRAEMPMNTRRRVEGFAPSPETQADIERICALWRDSRARFGAKGDFLFGDFTNADAMYAPVCSRFRTFGIALDRVCGDYVEAVLSLPAAREWYAEAEQDPLRVPAYGD